MTEFPSLTLKERDLRWANTRAFLADHDLDCLIMFGLKGRERYDTYLSNEYLEGLTIFPAAADPIYLTWHFKMISRHFSPNLDPDIFWIKDKRVGLYGPGIVEALTGLGLTKGRIGIVGLDAKEAGQLEGIVSHNTWRHILDNLPDARFEEVTIEFGRVMMVKSDETLNLVRHSAMIGERCAEAMIETTRPGVLENEVCAAVFDVIHKHGARPADPFMIMTMGPEDVGWYEPPWTQSGGRPREINEGDVILSELFPTYGGIETQQQVAIAIGDVDPIYEELQDIINECLEAGIAKLRPGFTFRDVCDAMVQPVIDHDCWNLTPMIHSINPLMWVSQMGINLHQMERLAAYPGANRPIPHAAASLEIRPGMSFAFEPNVCRGNHRLNLGGAAIVTDGEPEILNNLPNRLNRIN